MAWVRVGEVANGQHASEVSVRLVTADGSKQTIFLDRTSVENGAIDVGFPVGEEGERLLVELPRETTNGRWRVWMDKSQVLDNVPA